LNSASSYITVKKVLACRVYIQGVSFIVVLTNAVLTGCTVACKRSMSSRTALKKQTRRFAEISTAIYKATWRCTPQNLNFISTAMKARIPKRKKSMFKL